MEERLKCQNDFWKATKAKGLQSSQNKPSSMQCLSIGFMDCPFWINFQQQISSQIVRLFEFKKVSFSSNLQTHAYSSPCVKYTELKHIACIHIHLQAHTPTIYKDAEFWNSFFLCLFASPHFYFNNILPYSFTFLLRLLSLLFINNCK